MMILSVDIHILIIITICYFSRQLGLISVSFRVEPLVVLMSHAKECLFATDGRYR